MAPVSVRAFLSLLVALAMFAAPAFTRSGEAMASEPHHSAAMADHCEKPTTDNNEHSKAPAKSCCISMCMAVAVAPAAPDAEEALRQTPAVFSTKAFHKISPSEPATPPPRLA